MRTILGLTAVVIVTLVLATIVWSNVRTIVVHLVDRAHEQRATRQPATHKDSLSDGGEE